MGPGGHDPTLTWGMVDCRVYALQQDQRPWQYASVSFDEVQRGDAGSVGRLAQLRLRLYPAAPAE